MTGDMHVLMGGIWGYIVGAVVWVAACYFTTCYRAQPIRVGPTQGGRSLHGFDGAISPLAATAQAGMAALGAYVCWRVPSTGHVVAALLVTAILAIISLVDLQVRRIPNALSLALVLWGLIQVLWLGRPTLAEAALGMLVGGALFVLIALAQRGAMGAGDVKLATALGAVLAYPLILRGLFWGVLAAGGGALAMLVTHRAGRRDTMAYGPYLALGAWLVWTGSLGLWP